MPSQIPLEGLKSLSYSPHARVRYRVVRELAENPVFENEEILRSLLERESHPGVIGAIRTVLRDENRPSPELVQRFELLLEDQESSEKLKTFLVHLVQKGRVEWASCFRSLSLKKNIPVVTIAAIRLTRLARQKGGVYLLSHIRAQGVLGRESREAILEIGGFSHLLALMDFAAEFPNEEPRLSGMISMEERLALREILEYEGSLEEEAEEESHKEAREVMELTFDTGMLPDQRIEKLREWLQKGSLDERVLANVVEGLGKLLGPEELPELGTYMKHSHNRVAANAIAAMGRLVSLPPGLLREMKKNLKRLAFSEDSWAPMSAIWCMDILRQKEFLPLLQSLSESKNPKISSQARQVLQDWAQEEPQVQENLHKQEEQETHSQLEELKRSEPAKPAPKTGAGEEPPKPLVRKKWIGKTSIEEAGTKYCENCQNADSSPRIGAAVLDLTLVFLPGLFSVQFLPPPVPGLVFLIGLLAYVTVFDSLKMTDASLGKLLFGIRTVNLDGTRAGAGKNLVRSILVVIFMVASSNRTILMGTGLALGWLWRDRGIAPWDLATMTRVIQIEEPPVPIFVAYALQAILLIGLGMLLAGS